jgi:heptaprenyl diphosphate synthase
MGDAASNKATGRAAQRGATGQTSAGQTSTGHTSTGHTAAGRVARLGMLLGVALALYAVESALPSPFPFLRIGLANIATLIALITLGFTDALAITLLRVIVASLVVGTFLGPGFGLAMAGGVAGVVGMGLAARFAFPPLSVVGVSVVGAVLHNLAQLGVLSGFYTGPGPALRLLPVALLVSAATGLATGLIALFALEKLGLIRR